MSAFEELTQAQQKTLVEATDKITVEMMNELEHGDELDLNKDFTLSHYTEEDVFMVNLKEDWIEIFQVMINGNEIELETL